MLQNLKKRMRSEQGFTLIELIVVVAILGILAAILMPKVLDAMSSAKDKGSISTGKQLQVAMERYNIANNKYPDQGASNAEDAKWLTDNLGTYVSINAANITTVDYDNTNGFTLKVTFADTKKTVTITPANVTAD